MAKKQTLQDIKAAQKKLKEMSKKESPKPRPKRKTVKEQYAELRPTTEPVVAEEVDELKLKNQLFGEELVEDEEESNYYTDIESDNESDSQVTKRDGLWDYVYDDEIKFFDPECSYELTGYRPISETAGLDFDPAPFCQTGRTYTETGAYTQYPKGSKPYADFWNEELRRCTEGYTIGQYRLTGDHYFFLNFYRMSIVDDTNKAAVGDTESFPTFAVEQYKWFHYIEMCEYLKKDIVGLKSRGVKLALLYSNI